MMLWGASQSQLRLAVGAIFALLLVGYITELVVFFPTNTAQFDDVVRSEVQKLHVSLDEDIEKRFSNARSVDENSHAELSNAWSQFQKQQQQALSRVEKQVDSLRGDLKSDVVMVLNSHMRNVGDQIATLDTKSASFDSRLKDMNSVLDSFRETLEALQTTNKAMVDDIRKLSISINNNNNNNNSNKVTKPSTNKYDDSVRNDDSSDEKPPKFIRNSSKPEVEKPKPTSSPQTNNNNNKPKDKESSHENHNNNNKKPSSSNNHDADKKDAKQRKQEDATAELKLALATVKPTLGSDARFKQFTDQFSGSQMTIFNGAAIVDWVVNSEIHVRAVMHYALGNGQCKNDNDKTSLVMDIGANSGYYGVLAAKYGCNVVFFEVQPECVRYLQTAILANDIADRATLIPHAVSRPTMRIPIGQNTGCAGVYPLNIENRNISLDGWKRDESVDIHDLFPNRRIRFAKIDVEGSEFSVLNSLGQHLERSLIDEFVIELSPKFWAQKNIEPSVPSSWYYKLHKLGYQMILFAHPRAFHVNPNDAALQKFVADYEFNQYDMWVTKRDAVGALQDVNTMIADMKTKLKLDD